MIKNPEITKKTSTPTKPPVTGPPITMEQQHKPHCHSAKPLDVRAKTLSSTRPPRRR